MKKRLIILPVIATLLSGCVGTKHYAPNRYMLDVKWDKSEDFKILQLSDIHLSQSDDHEQHFAVIDRTIKASKPNMIVLNGDIFTFADKHVVNKVFNFIDSFKIPWTYTFGNHDDQGYYNDMYIPRLLDSAKKDGKFKYAKMVNLEDDDVTGRTNFVINLVNGLNVEYQVYILDSHSYNFETMKYDALKKDQIDWYERVVKYSTKEFGGGTPIKSSLYMHIGMPEVMDPWDQAKSKEDQKGLVIGDMEEWGGSPDTDPGSFKSILKYGSTQSIHVAHDHANDSVMRYLDKNGNFTGVYVCFGVHSTNRIYNDDESVKFGGQVVKIDKTTKELSFKNYYVSYSNKQVKTAPTEGWGK